MGDVKALANVLALAYLSASGVFIFLSCFLKSSKSISGLMVIPLRLYCKLFIAIILVALLFISICSKALATGSLRKLYPLDDINKVSVFNTCNANEPSTLLVTPVLVRLFTIIE